ncbi:PH domain-containing protein [Amycolatopsis cihanbeyliensis]|uniref:PH (Pleckstrin Homology) domain-containing protein n=1 Tax=Amycolatopsis cihanbeyliensis TaxID=1128664 RepID=A0A542DLE1_AMYCI|nr:PH domain-containing protein [Amycolatopsis cihanbeyliensis]TQJ03898.1 PH (Pleckstrin Homology) domain-containing protein [Amycolatopsis cihanbeyliensis]
MDNSNPKWAPRTAVVAVGWMLAAFAAAGTVVAALEIDPPGAVLLGVGTLALAAAAAHGTVVRPRLAADRQGIRVRTLAGSHRLDWAEARVRLATVRRLGREVTTLEIDPTDPDSGLIVLGALELGADPRDVLTELRTQAGWTAPE